MIIKSAENLCKNYRAFSEMAHASGEPIYVTLDGEGDLVLLSIEAYERLFNSSKSEVTEKKQMEENKNMTVYVLGNVLREMYNTSPRGQQVTNIHTFAIFYAKVIEEKRISKKEILRIAELPESYQTELSKGINLATYVDVKPEQAERIRAIEAYFN